MLSINLFLKAMSYEPHKTKLFERMYGPTFKRSDFQINENHMAVKTTILMGFYVNSENHGKRRKTDQKSDCIW